MARREGGLTASARRVLAELRTDGRLSNQTLCVRTGYPRRTVQRAITNLIEAGVVTVSYDSSHDGLTTVSSRCLTVVEPGGQSNGQ